MKYRKLWKIAKNIKEHEGLRLKAYKCTAGKTTIGYGRNLDDNGISEQEAEALLHADLRKIKAVIDRRLGEKGELLPDNVYEVLVEMAYQMGLKNLFQFKKTLKFIEEGDYKSASKEMLDSEWFRQTPGRATILSIKMSGGD
jgi:lysozyme